MLFAFVSDVLSCRNVPPEDVVSNNTTVSWFHSGFIGGFVG